MGVGHAAPARLAAFRNDPVRDAACILREVSV